MASRFHSEFPEKKISGPGRGPVQKAGLSGKGKMPGEKTANWKSPGPTKGSNFNRKMKSPVVKTRAKKHGVD